MRRRGFLKALAVGMAVLSVAGGIPPATKRKKKRRGQVAWISAGGHTDSMVRVVDVDHARGTITVDWTPLREPSPPLTFGTFETV